MPRETLASTETFVAPKATSIRWFYGDSMIFSYDMQPPAKDKVAAWLTENGLELRDYDLLDGRGKMSLYGFVLASPTY